MRNLAVIVNDLGNHCGQDILATLCDSQCACLKTRMQESNGRPFIRRIAAQSELASYSACVHTGAEEALA